MQASTSYSPVIEIRLYDPTTGGMRPLPPEVMFYLRGVSLESEVGLAKACTLAFDAWDSERGTWAIVDETLLWPGTEFELWSGSETPDFCHGLFRVHSNEPECPSDGLPSVTIRAMDGLSRFVDRMESFVFEGTTSVIPAIQATAYAAGMEVDADPSLASAPKGDIAKEVGRSDLEWLKEIAMTFGLGMPRVRYTPDPTGRGVGRETLVMRKLNVATLVGNQRAPRFRADHGMWLRYVATDPSGGELASFQPAFDLAGVPVGVEVIGLDRQQHPPKVVRVTVKMSPAGPVVESEEALGAVELRESTSQLRKWDQFSRKKIQSGADVVLALLGEGGQGVETGVRYRTRTKKTTVKERRWAREVLYAETDATNQGIRQYALNIMRSRVEGFWTCTGSLQSNISGSHRMDIDQVHFVDGVPPAHVGYYILTQVNIDWDAGSGINVNFNGQKLMVEGG